MKSISLGNTVPDSSQAVVVRKDSRRAPSWRGTLAALLLLGSPAMAAPVVLLNDNFNTENGAVGAAEYSRFANWTAANIDLLAPGYFYALCQAAGGSTPCVDMEGSGNGSLTTAAAFAFPAGPVTVQFDLAGDQRGRSNNSVTMSLVSTLGAVLFSELFSLPSNAPFTTITRSFDLSAATSARLRFLSSGPADSIGLLLDNVLLTQGGDGTLPPGTGTGSGPNPVPVPEPGGLPLLLVALAGLALLCRRGQGLPGTATG